MSEVQEAMVAEAREESGALPLVENALQWLWEQRAPDGRLSGRLLTERGGLAGILSRNADDLLQGLGQKRDLALELLFWLVKVDPEGRRHIRQRMPLPEAVAIAGGGEDGRALVDRLAGTRTLHGPKAKGPLRLITITGDAEDPTTAEVGRRSVNLIHETLIRSRGSDVDGNPQPYWPMLWRYVEENKHRAVFHEVARILTAMRRQRLRLQAQEWQYRKGAARLFGLAGWSEVFGLRALSGASSIEQRYLRWSAARCLVQAGILVACVGIVGENIYWAAERALPLQAVVDRWSYKLFKQLPFPHRVEIRSGSFEMGSSKGEQPPRNVTFAQPFELGATEVTFREWDACVVDDACKGYAPADLGWGRDMQPVINVSWEDANAYAEWLGRKTGRVCRLPSEAEWEYACRAGTTTAYALPSPEGSDDIARKGLANCADCGSEWDGKQTAPVGSFPANAWGVSDMHGNVNEWVEDCWHYSYEDAPEEGQAWLEQNGGICDHRVVRGGSFHNNQDGARCAVRLGALASSRGADVGFRMICSSPSTSPDH